MLSQRNFDAVRVVREFLSVDTPAAWFKAAADNLPLLLMDHANCEKKAASTALSVMYRYVVTGARGVAAFRAGARVDD